MKASIVDLRYKMKEVLKALDRNEEVTIFYHGKAKGVIRPVAKMPAMPMKDHPFFGMYGKETQTPVEEVINELRGGRYGDL